VKETRLSPGGLLPSHHRDRCPRAAAARPGWFSFISGEMKTGGDSICLCLIGVLLWPPQKAALDMIILFYDLYPINVFHYSFNFSVWCCSRYISLWTKTQHMSVLNYKRAAAGEGWGRGVGDIKETPHRREIISRGQSYFSRLPKYWPPIPLSARQVCPPPTTKAGGTHSPGGEGIGGQYFGRRET
jgi:hypothetical protein